jgi:hypothetical protein
MEHIAPLNNISRRTKAFARLWSMKFIALHPNWEDGDAHTDEWYSFGGYDINLYCEDGYLSVCAYGLYKNEEDEFLTTDHDDFVHLVQKGVQ